MSLGRHIPPPPGSHSNLAKRFKCPACGGPSRVKDTRTQESGKVWRMRWCIDQECKTHFVTEERFLRYTIVDRVAGKKFGWCGCVCHQEKYKKFLEGVECDRCRCTPEMAQPSHHVLRRA